MIKKLFAATAVAVLPLCSIGQTFMTTSSGVIPDNNTAVCFDVVVSGLPAQIDPSFGISMVCLDLTHTYDGDIRIFLKAPDNSIVVLSNHNGGSGDNYTSTCFAENGANGWIMQGGAPFTGNWYPEYSLNTFNNGMDPNGTWQICIHDEVPADSGYFNFGTITFSANPPPDPGPPPVCNTTVATTCECPDTTMTDCDLLPDMTASAVIIQQQHTEYTDYLTLSNATPNIGYGPLEIRGINVCYCDTQVVGCATPICPDGSYPKQMITQRVYHKNGTTMTYADYPSGTMTYHPNHGHMHVDNWAIYTLRKATSDPLPTNWPIIGRGSKVSYCLVNLGSCTGSPGYCVDSLGNTILGADLPNLGLGAVTGCGNEQGIYVGSLDVYGQGLYGQQIDFPGICNDDYYVVSETDPLNNFLETNDNNNWAAVPITLSLQGVGPANPSFTQTANGLTVDFSSNVPGVTSYKYFFGDGDSSNVPVVSHTYAVAGTYTVVLELFNGVCTATVAQVVTVTGTTGFSEAIVTDVNLIPNPFSESSEISFELSSATQLELSVYDLKGSLVSTLHNGMMPAGKQRIPITGLNAGTYVVRMQTAKTVSNHRLVKL